MSVCAREIPTVVRQPCPVYLFSQTDGLRRSVGNAVLTDDKIRKLLEIMSGHFQVGEIGHSIEVTQGLLDVVVEGIITGILVQDAMNETVQRLAEAGLSVFKVARIITGGGKFRKNDGELYQPDGDIPEDLIRKVEEAIENDLDGFGAVAIAASRQQIGSRVRGHISGDTL